MVEMVKGFACKISRWPVEFAQELAIDNVFFEGDLEIIIMEFRGSSSLVSHFSHTIEETDLC